VVFKEKLEKSDLMESKEIWDQLDYQGTEELMAKKVSQVVKETKGQMELKDTLDHEDDEETEVLMDHEEPQDQPENQDQQATPLTPKS